MEDPQLKSCGCCEAPAPPTPEEIKNRPGLSAIRYRVGAYASFRQAMIEAIARQPELRGWTARTGDDYGIALLEMWAYLSDILTFYQERIANEAFLRTALLRESVLQLAALLDYEPAPGVAATAYLAFTLDKDKQVKIPVGLRVQSVPGQDEKPQKFETVKTVSAGARLNRIRIYPQPQPINPLAKGSMGGALTSDSAELAPGDNLVIFTEGTIIYPGGPPTVEEKQTDIVEHKEGQTVITWSPAMVLGRGAGARVYRFQHKFRLFGADSADTFFKPGLPSGAVDAREIVWQQVNTRFVTYKYGGGPETVRRADIVGEDALDLDGPYDDLKPGTELLIVIEPPLETYTENEHGIGRGVSPATFVARRLIKSVRQVTASWGSSTGPATRVTLQDSVLPGEDFDIRNVTIYELSGPGITFWNRRYPDTISGNTVYAPLSQLKSLEPKRTLVLDDKAAKPQMVTATAASPVDADGDGKPDHLAVAFTPALKRSLDSKTAVLYGNVAKATHGETVAGEILGSGDASTEFQSFAIKKSPVTFVPQPGASHGAANTLQVRAGGVLWHAVKSLYGRKSDERIYTTAVDDDDTMSVQFGDGVTGSRLPSGRNNVVATYRQGLGRDGNVKASSLTTLLDRPVGLKGVTNPGAAQGGADPESLEKARSNAPNTVRTFGRIVSLRDFEDAAREFAGVAKARASWVWDGEEQVVHLTVAGDKGDPVTGETHKNLVKDLNSRRDPNRKLVVDTYRKVPVEIEAVIQVHSDYVAEDVQASAEKALQSYFAFGNLDLGQPIHLSDVYRVLQDVKGVVAVDTNRLQFKKASDRESHGATPEPVQGHLRIYLARVISTDPVKIAPAELAIIESPTTDIDITVSTG